MKHFARGLAFPASAAAVAPIPPPLFATLSAGHGARRLARLALALALMAFASVIHAAEPSFIELNEGWQYRYGESPVDAQGREIWLAEQTTDPWRPTPVTDTPAGWDGHQPLWLRMRLPDLPTTEPVVFLRLAFMTFDAYLGQELIHRYDDEIGARGTPWHVIRLPQDFAGRVLTLKVRSFYNKIGVANPQLSDHAGLMQRMTRHDILRVGSTFLMASLGVFALLVAVARRRNDEFLAFGIYALAAATWSLSHTDIKLLLVDSHRFWFYAWLLGILVSPLSYAMFVERVFGAGRGSVIRRLWQIQLALAIAGIGAHGFGYVPAANLLLNAVRLWFLVTTAVVIVHVAALALRGNAEAKIFLMGTAVFILFAIHDVVLAVSNYTDNRVQGHWGILVFVLTLGGILIRRFVEIHRRLRDYTTRLQNNAKEKEALVQDLHDGLGGLATNIGLLADLSRKDESLAAVRERLASISSLSRQAVSDIRGFMQHLEESGIDWPTLTANLRLWGRNMVEPHGIAFTFEASIEPGVPDPDGALRLNLFQTYKEVLTNTVKHANAGRVDIELAVCRKTCRLTVRDDGVGLSGANHGTPAVAHRRGRGMQNLRQRAQRLGGTLAISGDGGTTVSLAVPITGLQSTGSS